MNKRCQYLYNIAINKKLSAPSGLWHSAVHKNDILYITSMNKYINCYENYKESKIKQYIHRSLSQVGSRRKRCHGQFGQDGMGSIPATLSTVTKHASCIPPSSLPASIEISIKAKGLNNIFKI